MIETGFSKMFGLKGPLVVAPLGGGPTTPELVIASCKAGALGSLAGAYLSPEQIQKSVDQIRSQTQKPFAINLFAPIPAVHISQDQKQRALRATRKFRDQLGLKDPEIKEPFHFDFEMQFEKVLSSRPAAFSFVFGLVDSHFLKECRKENIKTIGAATTLEEAFQLQESGVDAVVAQGVEAGGHRAIFSADDPDPGISTLVLTSQMSEALSIPVIASGGIMTGAEMARVLQAGAQAVQLGTVFLLCDEAGTSSAYRKALQEKPLRPTKLTKAFSGRWARGLENQFMKEMDDRPEVLLPFPAQNAFTRDLRQQATLNEDPEFLSLWAGTGVAKIRSLKTAVLIEHLFAECEKELSTNFV